MTDDDKEFLEEMWQVYLSKHNPSKDMRPCTDVRLRSCAEFFFKAGRDSKNDKS